jgi:hypothetical protein
METSMNFRNLAQSAVVTGVLVFVVSAVVSYLYGLLAHGTGLVDWEGSFRFALILAIVFPAIREIDRRKKS